MNQPTMHILSVCLAIIGAIAFRHVREINSVRLYALLMGLGAIMTVTIMVASESILPMFEIIILWLFWVIKLEQWEVRRQKQADNNRGLSLRS